LFPIAWVDKKEESLSCVFPEMGFGGWIASLEPPENPANAAELALFRDSLSAVIPALENHFSTEFFVKDLYKDDADHDSQGLKEMRILSSHLIFMLNAVAGRVKEPKEKNTWASILSAICCTTSTIELASRESPNLTVSEVMNYNTLCTMRQLCEFALAYSYCSNTSPSLYRVNSQSLFNIILGDSSLMELPVLQKDVFCLFVEASLAIIPKRSPGSSKDVLRWVRLFYYLNVMQSLLLLVATLVELENPPSEDHSTQVYPLAKSFFNWFISKLGYTRREMVSFLF
jgi:hypothetical protein